MLSIETNETKKGMGIHARRILAYVVLILVSFLCLFWFYVLFVNATRSHGELTKGFTPIPSTYLLKNWQGVMAGTLPIVRGMFNSLFVALCSAALCTYFSTMTAYAIHVYDFKIKKFMFTFIMAVMTIPTQVTALGFLQLVSDMKLEDNSFDRSCNRCSGYFLLYETVHGERIAPVSGRGSENRRFR